MMKGFSGFLNGHHGSSFHQVNHGSDRKVRKLLKGIKGDMSQEIIMERGNLCDSESTNMEDNVVTPDKARELLRGSGKGENLCEKLLKSRKEDLIWG